MWRNWLISTNASSLPLPSSTSFPFIWLTFVVDFLLVTIHEFINWLDTARYQNYVLTFPKSNLGFQSGYGESAVLMKPTPD